MQTNFSVLQNNNNNNKNSIKHAATCHGVGGTELLWEPDHLFKNKNT